MTSEAYRLERSRQRRCTLRATVALGIWALGAVGLYQAWRARTGLSPPLDDVIGTATYLATFFYIFAFWPISVAVERLFRDRRLPGPGRHRAGARRANGAPRP